VLRDLGCSDDTPVEVELRRVPGREPRCLIQEPLEDVRVPRFSCANPEPGDEIIVVTAVIQHALEHL